MKEKIVHKGVYTCHGIYNLCNNRMDGSKFTRYWRKVTCKKCKKRETQ